MWARPSGPALTQLHMRHAMCMQTLSVSDNGKLLTIDYSSTRLPVYVLPVSRLAAGIQVLYIVYIVYSI